MSTKCKITEHMDKLISIFNHDRSTMRQDILTYLILCGWKREKASTYAIQVEDRYKESQQIISIWPGE